MMARKFNLTASMLRTYKSCPRLYELQYREMLKPAVAADYLTTGTNYHSAVESILKGEPFDNTGIVGAMADAFYHTIPWRDWNIQSVEYQFDVAITSFCHMQGKMDALCVDGTPIEHKTTSAAINEKYIHNLAWDDQVSFYLLALSLISGKPVTRVIYTVCQKPSIRLKKNQTEEEYIEEVRGWYTPEKIQVLEVVRSVAELKETEEEVRSIVSEIRRRKHFYRNPRHCSMIGCPYASICLNYDPEITTGFVKKTQMSEELAPCAF